MLTLYYRDTMSSIINCLHRGATPYSLVYDIEAVLPVEIEMGSLRVALERDFEVIRRLIRDPKGSLGPIGVDNISLGVDPNRCYMVDGSRWKPILGANQCRSTKEVLCLRLWS
ncbi:hypothetical protein AAG906_039120 [Vitis piasezkii]